MNTVSIPAVRVRYIEKLSQKSKQQYVSIPAAQVRYIFTLKDILSSAAKFQFPQCG